MSRSNIEELRTERMEHHVPVLRGERGHRIDDEHAARVRVDRHRESVVAKEGGGRRQRLEQGGKPCSFTRSKLRGGFC
jgi:hypothetical protein